MNTALTPSHVLRAFAAMEESTLKRPASLVTEAKLKAAATTWVAILAPMMSAEVFADAVMAHMRDPEEGRFWPTPAHIIKQVGNISRDGVPSAATAFPRVLARRGSYGPHREADAMDQLVADGFPRERLAAGIKALGGWESLGMIPDPRYGGDAVGHGIAGRTYADAYIACDASTSLVKA